MTGPPRRAEETRARILAAARRLFAAEGFERTTVRAVAAASSVDPALVLRYFGSKEGLFAAAAAFDLRLPDPAALPPERLGAALVAHFLARWEGDPEDGALPILLRSAVTHAEAAARMREIFARQLLPAIARVAPAGEAERRAGLVASQVLGFALCRYILALPGAATMTGDEMVAWLGPTIQRYLTGPAPPAAPPPGPPTAEPAHGVT
jgi:AcrR family transcriptional regulator